MKKITTSSEEETRKLGGELWQKHKRFLGKKAVVFALEGKLGVGKTQLVKGLAEAMGIEDDVISPTFTLEAEYDLGKLVHIDAWRIEDPKELLRIGFKGRVNKKQVIVVEWADKVREVIEQVAGEMKVVWVKLEYGENVDERVIKVNLSK